VSIDRIPIPTDGGALWLAGRDDIAPDPEGALRRAENASTIVCLNEERELAVRYPDYPAWLRANAGSASLWYPTGNFDAGDLAQTMPLLSAITERLASRRGVIVHCAMGQGRAGTIAVCTSIMLGSSPGEALETVATHRTCAGPSGRAQWALVEAVAEQYTR
jgi:protein-tyrosine phosphatase